MEKLAIPDYYSSNDSRGSRNMKTVRQMLRILASQVSRLGTLCNTLLHKAEPDATVSTGDEDALVLQEAGVVH